MKKTVIFLLISAMLLGTFSCGSGYVSVTTTAAPAGTDSETLQTDSTEITPELPERDFEGYEFTLLTTDEVGSTRYSIEIDADAINGEVINDAVYKRNMQVEDAFNITITQAAHPKATFRTDFINSVMASDDSFDVLVDTYRNTLSLSDEYGMDISQLPYVDIDKPWWDGNVIRESAVGGKMYGLLGDINITDNISTWCLLFNKRIAADMALGNIYDTVRDGKWTVDELDRLCRNVTNDLNGDGVLDVNDRWGMVGSKSMAISMLWSCGGNFGKLDSDGVLELTLDTEKNINILDRVRELFSKQDTVLLVQNIVKTGTQTTWDILRGIFNDGRALFIGGIVGYVDYFREMNDEFGILPLPKYDEAQDGYLCTSQEACATMFMVPKTAGNAERSSIILESMAYNSMSTLTPAYYNVALKRKKTRDDDSSEMLDIIFKSRVFDIVYAFNFGNITTLDNSVVSESNTIASDIAAIKDAVQAAYDKLLTQKKDS